MRHNCCSLSLLALIALLLAVGGGAYWPYSGGLPVDATTSVNAPPSQSANDGTVGQKQPTMVSSSFHELTLTNNGCVYHNGMITENGGQSRKATAEEEAKVKEYLATSQRYQQQFQQSMAEQMQRIFAPPFPFGQSAAAWQFPQFPQFPPRAQQMAETPCFCESCRNAASLRQQVQSMSTSEGRTSGDNTANTYNQYSVVGGQHQQQ